MASFKIIFDKTSCIGCRLCEELNPDNWKISDEEGKSQLICSKKEGNNEVLNIDNCKKDIEVANIFLFIF